MNDNYKNFIYFMIYKIKNKRKWKMFYHIYLLHVVIPHDVIIVLIIDKPLIKKYVILKKNFKTNIHF